MIGRLANIIRSNPLYSVMILSGLMGFGLGLSNATWQNSVETGQVLAGIVRYPADNLFYMYHLKAFSIINHFSAVLLLLLDSEKTVSFLISGLLGMVSFAAISLLIFSISKNAYISVLGVIFIYFLNYVGNGVIYPIALLGQPVTFGILGLSFIVLTITLFASKSYRTGLFCLGLAPYVHITLAAWLFLIMLTAAFFHSGSAKKIVKEYYPYFLAGLLISASGLLYQIHLMHNLPKTIPEIKNLYLDSFIKYWDSHRKPLYWDFQTGRNGFKHKRGIIFCLYSVIAAILALRYFKKDGSLSFLFRVIAISGILSLLLGLLTQLFFEKIPSWFLIFMFGRFINFSNIVMLAMLLVMLLHSDLRGYVGNYNVFAFFFIASFGVEKSEVQLFCFAVIILWLVYIAFKANFAFKIPFFLSLKKHKITYEQLLTVFMLLFLLINLPNKKFTHHYLVRKTDFANRTDDKLYSLISSQNDTLATAQGFPMLALKTRRPILIDMDFPNFFTYAPESSIVYANILKNVYGVDLLILPPSNFRHREIPAELYKQLWEKRSLDEWRSVGKKFGFCDVLTPVDWKLSLLVVSKNVTMVLYRIPVEVK